MSQEQLSEKYVNENQTGGYSNGIIRSWQRARTLLVSVAAQQVHDANRIFGRRWCGLFWYSALYVAQALNIPVWILILDVAVEKS
ncbi:MAG: hypothetical protein PHD65_02635 [Gallionella sp.]|nr:hypothetical protein [Gallionella sp.]